MCAGDRAIEISMVGIQNITFRKKNCFGDITFIPCLYFGLTYCCGDEAAATVAGGEEAEVMNGREQAYSGTEMGGFSHSLDIPGRCDIVCASADNVCTEIV